MEAAIAKMSSKGQIVIPSNIITAFKMGVGMRFRGPGLFATIRLYANY